jgi:hypothetical protein
MGKILLAFFLGLFSFFVLMFVGETASFPAGVAAMAAYLCFCQFLLSRKHVDAHRNDWSLMLALDAVPLLAVLMMFVVEKQQVILSQGPAILLATFGATYLGAVVASLTARAPADR